MAARSVDVELVNDTDRTLTYTDDRLDHGRWAGQPPKTMAPYSKAKWRSESHGFMTGTEGWVTYSVERSTVPLRLYWDDPYWGSNRIQASAPPAFSIDHTGGTGNRTDVLFNLKPIQLPSIPMKKLQVKVETSSAAHAGTDNDVYFDIGPLGWKLSSARNDFERGVDHTYDCPFPQDWQLTTDDVVWLRLHKKGLGGVDGTTDLPDGEWKPERIHLLVNERVWASFSINEWLASPDHPIWIVTLRDYSVAELFARSLRMIPNGQLRHFDEDIALITTPLFKEQGISGWQKVPSLPLSCATGTVLYDPGRSQDSLATIDLQMERLDVGERDHFLFDGKHGINRPRFLRVEYRFREHSFPIASGQNYVPQRGERVRICGEVKWDTDQEGWYEIHPRDPSDVHLSP